MCFIYPKNRICAITSVALAACRENASKNSDDIVLCESTQNMIMLFLSEALSLHLSTMCLEASPRSPGTVFHGDGASNLRVPLKTFKGPLKKRFCRGPFHDRRRLWTRCWRNRLWVLSAYTANLKRILKQNFTRTRARAKRKIYDGWSARYEN